MSEFVIDSYDDDTLEFKDDAMSDFHEAINAGGDDAPLVLTSGGSKSNENKEATTSSNLVKEIYPKEVFNGFPELSKDDLSIIIFSSWKARGPAGHHIESMNSFYDRGIKQIITEIFSVTGEMKNERTDEEGKDIDYINFEVKFTDANMLTPTTTQYQTGRPQMLTPNAARLRNMTYSAPLFVDAVAKATAVYKDTNRQPKTITADIKNFRIAGIPVMVGSKLCHTYNLDRESKIRLQEDPKDPGGYFIIKGGEWAVDNLENIHINDVQVFRNMHQKEIARASIISKPGDGYENSWQIILRYLNNGAITVELTAGKKDKVDVPFYLIFRAFGMTQDRDIINHIVYGVDNTDPVSKRMMEILSKAFLVSAKEFAHLKISKAKKDEKSEMDAIAHTLKSRNQQEIAQFLGKRLKKFVQDSNYEKDEEAVKFVYTESMKILDNKILPHCGVNPSARISKLWFLGHLINKLLRVEIGVSDSTDRDSYKNKRLHTAGVSIAKTFKTHYNFVVIQAIKKHLMDNFKTTPFSKVKLESAVKTAVNIGDLESVITKSITTGNKTVTIRRHEVNNRVSSQLLFRKNDLNVYSILNTINTPNSSSAKQTERSDEMRRVHPTYTGYIDHCQSAEGGEKVGMSKQICVSASILDASNSYILKQTLFADPAIIKLDKIIDAGDITSKELSKVFVNGDWIGVCKESYKIAAKYRMARRYGDINEFATIVWEPMVRELYFWVDNGRMVRPLIIVYNNIEEYIKAFKEGRAYVSEEQTTLLERIHIPTSSQKKKQTDAKNLIKFQQWTKLKKEHIIGLQEGTITMDDLRKQRIIEYIAPEEAENVLIAENYELLKEKQNDIEHQFTHCDIELATLGIVSLSSPYVNHTPATRITMFTNHKKQTCGWFALNWPYRMDKGVFLQYYCEVPLVRTFTDGLTNPNGQNVIVAYMIHTGFNQEDSAVINASAIDRGVFVGSYFMFEKTELGKDEEWGNPDLDATLDIKYQANYEKTDKGRIIKGSLVKENDILFVKSAKIQKPNDPRYTYTDRSIRYKMREPAYVEEVIETRNDEDIELGKVKLRTIRPLIVGDKISSTNGNKSIVGLMCNEADMPYAEDGLVPDVLLNPHAIPTRMVIGQIIATVMGELSVRKGTTHDAKPFKKIDIVEVIKELEGYGINNMCHKRLYNGRTGNWIDTLIFIGPVAYQRQKKFVLDNAYAVHNGPISNLTRQPTEGKANEGGLRLGEMEKDVIVAHSAMRTLYEKFYEDSDGIKLPICRCGERAIINEKENIYKCKKCGDSADISMVHSSWVANIFMHEAAAMGIPLKLELAPYAFGRAYNEKIDGKFS